MSGSSRSPAGSTSAEIRFLLSLTTEPSGFVTQLLIIRIMHFPAKSMHHEIIPGSRHIPHSAYVNLESPAIICAISRNATCNNKAAPIHTQNHLLRWTPLKIFIFSGSRILNLLNTWHTKKLLNIRVSNTFSLSPRIVGPLDCMVTNRDTWSSEVQGPRPVTSTLCNQCCDYVLIVGWLFELNDTVTLLPDIQFESIAWLQRSFRLTCMRK